MYIHYKNIFVKLLIFFILLLILGVPINNPYKFYFLLFFLPILIFSYISIKKRFLYYVFFLLISFCIFKYLFPSISIHEGHNLVLLNNNSSSFYKNNLPSQIYDFFSIEFQKHYKKSNCEQKPGGCWKNFNPSYHNVQSSPTNDIFATSSDWSLKKIKYSRIVNEINFYNLKSAKIGAINNLDYNYFWLTENDVHRETMPFFVMYEFTEQLKDNDLCWQGNLFWEIKDNNYNLKFNENYSCTKIKESNIGKKIYGISFGEKNKLILKLEQNNISKLKKYLDLLFKFILIGSIVFSVLKFDYKIFLISFSILLGFIALLFYVNKDLFYGFDIFTGGNDGLLYMSYGNVIFNNLVKFNFYEALKGVEGVYYFPSSLRYFWSINKIFFGETLYGYLTIAFLYPILFYLFFKNFLGFFWALILTPIISLTRLFEGYSLSVINMIQHINAGDAEPIAIFLILISLIIFFKITSNNIIKNSNFYNFLFGFFLFLSVSLRPNFFPTVMILIVALIIYNFICTKKHKPILFTIFGFIFILLIPLHNYYFGGQFILFSSGAHHNMHAPPSLYYQVFKDIIQLNINDNSMILINQFKRWIQPKEIHYVITFFIVILLLIKNNNFVIKTLCILALSQHCVLLIYEPDNRYAYLAWIITLILNFYFLKFNLIPYLIKIKKLF